MKINHMKQQIFRHLRNEKVYESNGSMVDLMQFCHLKFSLDKTSENIILFISQEHV